MQIRVERKTFFKELARTLGVVERKSTMPILANVLLETVGNNELKLTATNLDVGIIGTCEADVKKSGRVAIDVKHLHDVVRELDAEKGSSKITETKSMASSPVPSTTNFYKNESSAPIFLNSLENHWIELIAGKAKFKIAGLAPDEFPALPDVESAKPVPIQASAIRAMLDRTAFSMSTDETRYNMNGLYFERVQENGKTLLRMVSTDTHRLSLVDQEVEKGPELKEGIILPRKGIAELRKLADDAGEDDVLFGVSGGTVLAKHGQTSLIMRLVEGQFPSYDQVIPKSNNNTMTLSKDRFVSTLRRVSVLSSDRVRGVRFQFKPNLMVLTASNPDFGEAHEEVEVNYKGDPITVGFNAKYLLDALSVLQNDEVSFSLLDDSSPGLLRGIGEDSYTHVIMPMRI